MTRRHSARSRSAREQRYSDQVHHEIELAESDAERAIALARSESERNRTVLDISTNNVMRFYLKWWQQVGTSTVGQALLADNLEILTAAELRMMRRRLR